MPKFLVALDGSKLATNALQEVATSLARPERDQFHLVHVVQHEKELEAHKDMVILSEAEAYLQGLGFTVTVEWITTENKSIGSAIIEYCNNQVVDFLVVGSRGMGMIKSALLGSVSEYCIHHAKCTVIVHRTQE